jgi:hypothetical protein
MNALRRHHAPVLVAHAHEELVVAAPVRVAADRHDRLVMQLEPVLVDRAPDA